MTPHDEPRHNVRRRRFPYEIWKRGQKAALLFCLCLPLQSRAQMDLLGLDAGSSESSSNDQKQPREETTGTTKVEGSGGEPEDARSDSAAGEDDNQNEQDVGPGSSGPRAPKVNTNEAASTDTLSELSIIERAHEVQQQLEQLQKQLSIPAAMRDLYRDLDVKHTNLKNEVRQARKDIQNAARWYAIVEIRFRLAERLRQLKAERAPFDDYAEQVGKTPARVQDLKKEWNDIRATLSEIEASSETRNQVSAIVVSLRLLALNASRVELTIGRIRSLFERMESSITEVLHQAGAGRPSLIEDFTLRDPQLAPATSIADAWQRLASAWGKQVRSWNTFMEVSSRQLLLHLLVLCGLLGATLRARWYYKKTGGEKMVEQHLVLQHPISSGLLLASLATIFIYPIAPVLVLLSVLALAMGTATILIHRSQGWVALGSAALIVPVVAHVFLEYLPRLDLWVVYVEGALVFGLSRWLLKHSPFTRGAWGALFSHICKGWMFFALLGMAAAFLSFSRSASILVDGSARLMLVTVTYRVAYDVCASLIELGFSSPWALAFNSFANHRAILIARAQLALRWFLLFLWVRGALRTYTLYGVAARAFDNLLDTTFSAGALDFSLGSLVTLALGIAIAVGVARFVRFVLAQDIMPRTGWRVGTWTAITASTYYVVLGFGIFTTLAAAGVKLDRLTILVSALGVGIGFGLQNIVQNFISGIILMFERPVNVGDKVQLDQMLGTVQTIGFRASRVRTFDGAEVIVPNSSLISDKVINWSLTDDRRRVEVEVGVKYGTDPEQVLALLLEAAHEHPEILDDPEPDALFLAFGDSSLDFRLRGYTDQGSRWMNIRSELTVAVNKKLGQAGIEVPFPQRDLHLRSIDQSIEVGFLPKRDPKQN